ncbi:MAG: hypothetical protein VB120_02250 [Lachnospiraceae bacterium]|nr:hypothetical protein [Lachnospiraceae bacterium]
MISVEELKKAIQEAKKGENKIAMFIFGGLIIILLFAAVSGIVWLIRSNCHKNHDDWDMDDWDEDYDEDWDMEEECCCTDEDVDDSVKVKKF